MGSLSPESAVDESKYDAVFSDGRTCGSVSGQCGRLVGCGAEYPVWAGVEELSHGERDGSCAGEVGGGRVAGCAACSGGDEWALDVGG